MCTVLPLIVDPDLPAELATMTPMYGGSGAAGGEVPPPADNQVVPHADVKGRRYGTHCWRSSSQFPL